MDLSLELLFFLFFFCDLSNLFLILELSEEFMFTNLAGGWLPHVKIAKKSENPQRFEEFGQFSWHPGWTMLDTQLSSTLGHRVPG